MHGMQAGVVLCASGERLCEQGRSSRPRFPGANPGRQGQVRHRLLSSAGWNEKLSGTAWFVGPAKAVVTATKGFRIGQPREARTKSSIGELRGKNLLPALCLRCAFAQ